MKIKAFILFFVLSCFYNKILCEEISENLNIHYDQNVEGEKSLTKASTTLESLGSYQEKVNNARGSLSGL
jgi:hypothetical protein